MLVTRHFGTHTQVFDLLWYGPTIVVSYAAPQAHGIVNVPLHRDYPPGIIFIVSHGRKDLYHV
jgi:hypothetical protein